MRLLPGSGAIDAADDAVLGPPFNLTTDQRGPGFPRRRGPQVDIGAYEVDIAQSSAPSVVNVLGDYDNGVCGLGDCTLREAIVRANAGSPQNAQIVFAPNVVGTINLTGPLPTIAKNIQVMGPGAGRLMVRRDMGGNYRIITISNGTTTGPVVTIRGLTLANGQAPTPSPLVGGGILNDHGTLTLVDSAVVGNTGTNGAGIYNNGINGGSAMLTITNCTLSANTGSFGGALFNHGFQGSATAKLTNTTISDNTAGRGAAVDNSGASGSASLQLTNCTLNNNSATVGGIYNDGISGTSTVTIANTILKTGSAGANLNNINNAGTYISQGHNLSSDAAGGDANPGPGGFLNGTGDIRNTDPKLDPTGLASNGGGTLTITLLANSPAVNTGGDSLAPTADQRGYSRKGVSDIGAFEFGGTIPVTLANISTRLRVETGDNVLIGGFIITGTQPKKVIVRGIGTSLPLADKLANPTLELHGPNGLIEANDNWVDSPNKQAIIDSTIPPASDLESAIVATLPANGAGYTAIVRGVDNGTGIGVVEAYDLDRTVDSKLANISTRGLVQTGDNVLIAGTIILGAAPQKVIVRAIGPSLPIAGKLENPTLELRDQNGGLLEANDNWVDSSNKQAIIDSTIPPANDLEAAIVATLQANGASYTAIVRGVNNTTGIAVVEVYALN
jgi:CSLREA domain-containing protein